MNVDYVIKLGGSLLYDCTTANILLDLIYKNKNANYVITVGSGYIGEMYKDFVYSKNNLNIAFDDSVRDYSNIQSINASILSSLNDNYIVCENKGEIVNALKQKKIPIADARGFLETYRKDSHQKSDVRAANICKSLQCDNLIIVTDVAGIFNSDPKTNQNAKMFEMVTAENLRNMGRTSVDDGLAEKIIEFNLNCCVVGIDNFILNNGRIDENLVKTGTVIKAYNLQEKVYE